MRFHKAVLVILFVAVSAKAEQSGGIDAAAMAAALGGSAGVAGAGSIGGAVGAHVGAEFGPQAPASVTRTQPAPKAKPSLGELVGNCLVKQGNPAASEDVLRRAGIQ